MQTTTKVKPDTMSPLSMTSTVMKDKPAKMTKEMMGLQTTMQEMFGLKNQRLK